MGYFRFHLKCVLMLLVMLALVALFHATHFEATEVDIDDTRMKLHLVRSSGQSSVINEDFLIVTAFSDNHLQEGIVMLQNLTQSHYKGRVAVYFMSPPNQPIGSARQKILAQQLGQIQDNRTAVHFMKVSEPFNTYCFKPQVIQMAIREYQPDVLVWADASVRFGWDPRRWITQMKEESVNGFVFLGPMSVGQNSHPTTVQYLLQHNHDNSSQHRQPHQEQHSNETIFAAIAPRQEVIATIFVMRLFQNRQPTRVYQAILQKWIACGVESCRQCMAPPGSARKKDERLQWKNKPLDQFLTHRQDQSVLGWLTYLFLWDQTNAFADQNITSFATRMSVSVNKGVKIMGRRSLGVEIKRS